MKLFDLFKKKDVTKVVNERSSLVPQVKTVNRVERIIHDDIIELIWFSNGPRKNYRPEEHLAKSEFYAGDLRITLNITTSGPSEPSAIDINLVTREILDISGVEKLPYYPSYSELTPEQRTVYLKFLENPYDTSYEIGYAFILYYGLERFLLSNKFEKAFEVILKLRDIHSNQSFQSYSGNALVLSCLYHKRPDMMLKFIESINKDFELTFSDNLFLLSAYSFEIPLSSKDIIRLAKTFEFTNKNYISKYSEMFNETMSDIIFDKFKKPTILLGDILNKKDFSKLRIDEMKMFANISISNDNIKVPIISESFKLKKTFYDLLEETHESVKKELLELRKEGNAPNPKQKSITIEKKILVFDGQEEKSLLAELKRSGSDLLRKHFTYNQILDFYYKYRNIDSIYISKCIIFGEEDISMLDSMQKEYISSELKKLNEYGHIYSKKDLESHRAYIRGGFKGNIPAFKRLAIIHEKNKDYVKGIEICDRAIQYYQRWGMNTDEFEDRKKKLIEKNK